MTGKKKPTISEIIEILARIVVSGIDDSSVWTFVSEEGQNEYAVWLVDKGTLLHG